MDVHRHEGLARFRDEHHRFPARVGHGRRRRGGGRRRHIPGNVRVHLGRGGWGRQRVDPLPPRPPDHLRQRRGGDVGVHPPAGVKHLRALYDDERGAEAAGPPREADRRDEDAEGAAGKEAPHDRAGAGAEALVFEADPKLERLPHGHVVFRVAASGGRAAAAAAAAELHNRVKHRVLVAGHHKAPRVAVGGGEADEEHARHPHLERERAPPDGSFPRHRLRAGADSPNGVRPRAGAALQRAIDKPAHPPHVPAHVGNDRYGAPAPHSHGYSPVDVRAAGEHSPRHWVHFEKGNAIQTGGLVGGDGRKGSQM